METDTLPNRTSGPADVGQDTIISRQASDPRELEIFIGEAIGRIRHKRVTSAHVRETVLDFRPVAQRIPIVHQTMGAAPCAIQYRATYAPNACTVIDRVSHEMTRRCTLQFTRNDGHSERERDRQYARRLNNSSKGAGDPKHIFSMCVCLSLSSRPQLGQLDRLKVGDSKKIRRIQ